MVEYGGIKLEDAIQCVGDGWRYLVERIYTERDKMDPRIKIVQVKEKFGRLRVYWDDPEWTEGKDRNLLPFCTIINEAEKESGKVCELCGKPGRITDSRGWLMCRCSEHTEHSV